ncbi:hypothetical protein [Nonomuraea sp. NPDC049709]
MAETGKTGRGIQIEVLIMEDMTQLYHGLGAIVRAFDDRMS